MGTPDGLGGGGGFVGVGGLRGGIRRLIGRHPRGGMRVGDRRRIENGFFRRAGSGFRSGARTPFGRTPAAASRGVGGLGRKCLDLPGFRSVGLAAGFGPVLVRIHPAPIGTR
ncbi:hypothetical protein SXANM310S_07180 [Streptomyces xanthochromogenes]